ncbi:ArgE/DapE family deacylase [Xylocopilactobacillus apicola]|uniref:Succinyl-diaminopimelate desuccinylase n=1 Tax=Xylocopilactobacillus apicola TaxID=2932184 RepID=A0AAU9D1V3_9LACO|nr:ArgE/DapE family deacylase [Xylocopilactobacillus apicola]BDR57684.1 succinyl-diaminopimelate desuccinylase [Xylocopilactobacillus apicola]
MKTEDKIEILRNLVSCKTVGGNEIEAAQYLKSVFDQHDIHSEVRPVEGNRANLVAEIGHGKPVLVVSGHLDVVAVNESEWESDPFTLTEKDGQLYGRGVTDMKSGMAAFVIAMIELKESNQPINGTVRLLATADEEITELGAEALYQDGAMKDADALLLGEPTGYFIMHTHTGAMDLDITALGQAAHSSRPQAGINAVENLIDFLDLLRKNILRATGHTISPILLKPTLFNLDKFHGGEQVNTIPSTAKAEVNIRTIAEYPNNKIVKIINDTTDAFNKFAKGKINCEIATNLIPIAGKPDSKLVSLLQKISQPYFKSMNDTPEKIKQNKAFADGFGVPYSPDKVIAGGAMGGTDASQLLADQPVGANYAVFGPGNETPHQSNEHLSKQMFLDFIEIYKQLFQEYFA